MRRHEVRQTTRGGGTVAARGLALARTKRALSRATAAGRLSGAEISYERDRREKEGGGVEVDAEEQSSLERPDGVPDGGRGTCSILPRTPLPRLSRAVFRGARFLPQEVLSSERREAPLPPGHLLGRPKATRSTPASQAPHASTQDIRARPRAGSAARRRRGHLPEPWLASAAGI